MIEKFLKNRAKTLNKTIVFPESECSRIIDAVKILSKEKIVKCILVVNNIKHEKQLKSIDGVKIINVNTFECKNKLIDMMYNKRKSKGWTLEKCEKMLDNKIYFATMLVECGYADGMVCGAITATNNSIRPALQIIKTKDDAKLASSCTFICKRNMPFCKNLKLPVVCLSDCGLNVNPNAEDLAEIAKQTVSTYKKIFPQNYTKVAFLSFSSNGSANDESINKIRQTMEILRKENVDFEFDGEMQFDCAISPKVAKIKYPNSKIAGRANIFIFPDLNAGNIAYKVMQYSMEADAVIGPVLQGLRKSVNDVSRGASVRDIVLISALTAIQSDYN